MADRPVVLVSHTHWDREWYSTFEAFRERLVEMMDGLIDLLDREPRFAHFHLDGQAAMIDDYLEVRPEREVDIRRLAAAGRISVGPWYTQMDEFLVSGESLVRNLEWGLRRAAELGWSDPSGGPAVGYLPDQFGHVGQMPQILRGRGLANAMVWRGVPSAVDRSEFRWQSPDGSEVLTQYMLKSYFVGGWLTRAQSADELADALAGAVAQLEPSATREALLMPVGGDHHIPAAALIPYLDEANAAGGVAARFGSIASFVADGEPPADLPVWRGEMRSSARAHLLPNVYSNRVPQKRERAQVEALVERYAEPLAALVPGYDWPAKSLARAWRLLLWNGAHDSACGCSIDEVARAVDARFEEARDVAESVASRALWALGCLVERPGRIRFNPSPFEREGVPGLGWSVGGGGDADATAEPVDAPAEVSYEGARVEARDRAGGLRIGFRVADEDDVGDLYTFCPPDELSRRDPTITISGPSPEPLGWQIEFAFPGSRVRLRVTRRTSHGETEPFLRIDGEIENERPDHRLRLHVALPQRAEGSMALSVFEVVSRPLVGEGSDLESPSPTWPARGAVSAGGLAVLSEGVFEYEVVDGRELAVTLLRCCATISRDHLATRPSSAGPDIATPDAQMLGTTPFSLAVMPAPPPNELPSAWERFALPIAEADALGGGRLPQTGRLLEIDGAELSAVRRLDDGSREVRIWNPSSVERHARVGNRTIALGPARIESVPLP
ncbi:MAG TPA: hypothetical protein VGH10_11675 [Actinomycetota bacterium]